MATVDVQHDNVRSTGLERLCFLITPMGQASSLVRKRANEVFRDYIEPACKATEYFPVRSDPMLGPRIRQGITNALNCASMTIAYMGGNPWNPNVMIEIGHRMSTKLPLVLLCDQDKCGKTPDFPFHLQDLWVVTLPVARVDPDKIEELVNVIRAVEKEYRPLEWPHPIALINVRYRETVSTQDLIYTAASKGAEELFGGDDNRLVGLTMKEFFHVAKRRMPPAQFAAFRANQRQVRKDIQGRMTNTSNTLARALIPMYFDQHPVAKYNDRAYLPVILEDHTPENKDWYNMRVLYLDVTSVSQKATNSRGEEYYYCALDVNGEAKLPPLQPTSPRRVFLSYTRPDRDMVKQVFTALKELFPREVEPWMDLEDLYAVSNYPEKLTKAIQDADHTLVFCGKGGPGNGQSWEYEFITAKLIENDRDKPKFRANAVLLDGVEKLPDKMLALKVHGIVRMAEIVQDYENSLEQIIFPDRK